SGKGSNGAGGDRASSGGSGKDGKPGSGGVESGVNQLYGGGGGSIYYDNLTRTNLMDGARGAVRVIWGTGRSFPNNAT
ncbi:MAG: hypothetical protein ACO3UU_07645, partial [Minisyncoccia bacterium]